MPEFCRQCGSPPAGGGLDTKHPMVAIQSIDPMASVDGCIKVDSSIHWAAWPVCDACWKQPEIKAHFCYRGQEEVFLNAARDQILRADHAE